MLAQPSPEVLTENALFDQREQARIVAAARALYISQGIAEVSLADIARYLRMPEHAVRRWFATPGPLVEAVVEAHAEAVRTELRGFRAQCSTAVEELLALRNWASSELRASSIPFFQQLEAQYPEARERWLNHLRSFPVAHLRANLHWGMEQGFYRADLAVDAQVAAWFERLATLRTTAATGPEAAEAHRHLLNTFLASIVTPAGALVARRLQEAAPYY